MVGYFFIVYNFKIWWVSACRSMGGYLLLYLISILLYIWYSSQVKLTCNTGCKTNGPHFFHPNILKVSKWDSKKSVRENFHHLPVASWGYKAPILFSFFFPWTTAFCIKFVFSPTYGISQKAKITSYKKFTSKNSPIMWKNHNISSTAILATLPKPYT